MIEARATDDMDGAGDDKAAAPAPATYGFGFADLRLRPEVVSDAGMMALCDALDTRPGQRSACISRILALGYDGPCEGTGSGFFDPIRLSIVDRIAAVFGLAHRMGDWPARFAARCEGCGNVNALRVSPAEYAYAPAATYASVCCGAWLMQPNGHHEARMEAGIALTLDDLRLPDNEGSETVLDPIDETAAIAELSRVAPTYTTTLPYRCAACGADNAFWFDPLDWIADHCRTLLRQVHILARTYGWSEAAITAMPTRRRLAYLAMIEAET